VVWLGRLPPNAVMLVALNDKDSKRRMDLLLMVVNNDDDCVMLFIWSLTIDWKN